MGLFSSDCLQALGFCLDVAFFLFCHIYPAWCSSELLVSVYCCLSLILERSLSLFFFFQIILVLPSLFFYSSGIPTYEYVTLFDISPQSLYAVFYFFTLLSLFILIFIDLTNTLLLCSQNLSLAVSNLLLSMLGFFFFSFFSFF